jgi:Icc-related predicted phosphoesterase
LLRKLIHASDAHCRYDKLRELVSIASRYELITFSGDLQCDSGMVDILAGASVRVLAVSGNMDDTYIARLLRDSGISIESQVVYVDGYHFAGVSGREPITSLNRVKQLIGELGVKGDKLILISHQPPKGVNDRTVIGVHAGLYELREFDEEVQPRIHLCGHIHEARGASWLGSTLVVNPGPLKRGFYAVIDIEGKEASLEKL